VSAHYNITTQKVRYYQCYKYKYEFNTITAIVLDDQRDGTNTDKNIQFIENVLTFMSKLIAIQKME